MTIDHLRKSLTGRSPSSCMALRRCITCGGSASGFRTELSAKEYGISQMCQTCQDDIFEWNPEDPAGRCEERNRGNGDKGLQCILAKPHQHDHSDGDREFKREK